MFFLFMCGRVNYFCDLTIYRWVFGNLFGFLLVLWFFAFAVSFCFLTWQGNRERYVFARMVYWAILVFFAIWSSMSCFFLALFVTDYCFFFDSVGFFAVLAFVLVCVCLSFWRCDDCVSALLVFSCFITNYGYGEGIVRGSMW